MHDSQIIIPAHRVGRRLMSTIFKLYIYLFVLNPKSLWTHTCIFEWRIITKLQCFWLLKSQWLKVEL